MTRKEFTKRVAERVGEPVYAFTPHVDAVIDELYAALAEGEEIRFRGFGTFYVKERAARQGRNVATGETIDIPARRVPMFKPGAELKRAVSGEEE